MRFKLVTTVALILLVVIAIASTGCSKSENVTITASIAANAVQPFQEIAKQFESETGLKVFLNFGASGTLATQIINGAPVDFFASADLYYVNELEEKGFLVPGSKHIYAIGVLTIWTPKDSNLKIESIQDLNSPDVKKISIANPDRAPYGVAAKEALQAVGLWDKLQPKFVMGENVNQAMQYATSGNVDVAIVPLSLSLAEAQNGQYLPVDKGLYRPIEQAMGVIKGTGHESEALKFEEFVRGPKGQAIFKKFGYDIPQ